MNEPPRDYIEHDPDEPPRDMAGNGVYWGAGAVLALIWAATLLTVSIDWHSFVLGGSTGLFLGICGIAYTGNKVPKWMRR